MPGVFFHEEAPPEIRHGIANGAKETFHAAGFVQAVGESQFDGIEFHGVRSLKVAAAVDEFTERGAVARF